MYEFRPQRTNNRAQKLIMLLFLGAAALFVLTIPLEGLPFLWAIQLVAIVSLVAAIFLVTRYMTKAYEYAVSEEDGGADLTVVEVSSRGRRRITVCRVSCSGITGVKLVEGKDESLRAMRKTGRKIYDYRPDISPDRYLMVETSEGGEELCLLFAYDEQFLRILETYCNGQNI